VRAVRPGPTPIRELSDRHGYGGGLLYRSVQIRAIVRREVARCE
jgi:hypothetical protein